MTLSTTICIAFDLFAVELSDTLSLETVTAVTNLCVVLAIAFAYCYLSDWITADLLEIGNVFYSSPWYRLLSVKQQQLLVLPIQRANRLVRLRSLGLIDCSGAVFLSVNKWLTKSIHPSEQSIFNTILIYILQIIQRAASYFLMIRNFNSSQAV